MAYLPSGCRLCGHRHKSVPAGVNPNSECIRDTTLGHDCAVWSCPNIYLHTPGGMATGPTESTAEVVARIGEPLPRPNLDTMLEILNETLERVPPSEYAMALLDMAYWYTESYGEERQQLLDIQTPTQGGRDPEWLADMRARWRAMHEGSAAYRDQECAVCSHQRISHSWDGECGWCKYVAGSPAPHKFTLQEVVQQ